MTRVAGGTGNELTVLAETQRARHKAADGWQHSTMLSSKAASRMSVHKIGAAALLISLCMGVISFAGIAGRRDEPWAINVHWLGLTAAFLVALYFALAPACRRTERLAVSVIFGLSLMVSRAMLYPTRFVYYDEMLHYVTLNILSRDHRVFSFTNSQLPASTYYPGLELATVGVQSVTGLPSHAAGMVVLLLARLILTMAIFLLAEQVTRDDRVASLACLIYACNPQYLYYNSQYAYESLALPLGIACIYLTRTRRASSPGSTLLIAATFAALVVTHHLTAILILLAYVVWAAIEFHRRRWSPNARFLVILSVVGGAAVFGWMVRPGLVTIDYLYGIARGSIADSMKVVTGHQSRTLFADSSGDKTPPWQAATSLLAVLFVALALLPSLKAIRKRAKRSALLTLLCCAALLYPIIPAGHLSPTAGEATDRSAGFLYVGVAVTIAWWVVRRKPRILSSRVITVIVSVIVFVGGTISGYGPPYVQLPGSYLVSADSRSVDGASLAAADWARQNLPPRSNILSDRVNGALMAGIGNQNLVIEVKTGPGLTDPSPVFTSDVMTPYCWNVLRVGKISYLVVDRRLSTALPKAGVYFQRGESGSDDRKKPISRTALDKFASFPDVRTLYDNSTIVIYDIRASVAAQ